MGERIGRGTRNNERRKSKEGKRTARGREETRKKHGFNAGTPAQSREGGVAPSPNGTPEFPSESVFHPCFIRGSTIFDSQGHHVLTMIVRDEETNISKCLSSVAGLFDEIVVVDTGSKDRTRQIAREFGARVFDFVWVDDFAAARNAALGGRPAIMRSGSMPMTWLTRRSG